MVNPPELHYIDYVAEKEPKPEETAEGESSNKEGPVLRDKKEKDIEKTPIMVTLRLEIHLIKPRLLSRNLTRLGWELR